MILLDKYRVKYFKLKSVKIIGINLNVEQQKKRNWYLWVKLLVWFYGASTIVGY